MLSPRFLSPPGCVRRKKIAPLLPHVNHYLNHVDSVIRIVVRYVLGKESIINRKAPTHMHVQVKKVFDPLFLLGGM